MEIREKLRRLMASRDKTQARLVRETGIKQQILSAICSGDRHLKLEEAVLLARALGVTVDYLADNAQQDPDAAQLLPDEVRILAWYRGLKKRVGESDAMQTIAAATKGPSLGEIMVLQGQESVPSSPQDQPERKPRRSGKR